MSLLINIHIISFELIMSRFTQNNSNESLGRRKHQKCYYIMIGLSP